ncbi:MAG: hypothetical protein ABIJ96_08285 [Elusimicrobiota bacterium]
MTDEIEEKKKYQFAVTCEACGEPLKLIRLKGEEWLAACSDPECETLHRGEF